MEQKIVYTFLGFFLGLLLFVTVCNLHANYYYIPNKISEIAFRKEIRETFNEAYELREKELSYRLPNHIQEEIKDFRPFVQDIVQDIYKSPEKIGINTYEFYYADNHKWGIWISSNFDYFRLYHPKKVDFTKTEKQYLWDLYQIFNNKKKKEEKDKIDNLKLD